MKNLDSKNANKIFTLPIVVILGALLCCALWGSATPFIKMGYRVMFEGAKPDVQSTILFAGIRFFFAGFITVAIYSIARKKLLYPKKENLGNVFDRFYRTDESRNSENGGYGIGLSMAKAITSAHNGKISAFSKNENHFGITVRLPICERNFRDGNKTC